MVVLKSYKLWEGWGAQTLYKNCMICGIIDAFILIDHTVLNSTY